MDADDTGQQTLIKQRQILATGDRSLVQAFATRQVMTFPLNSEPKAALSPSSIDQPWALAGVGSRSYQFYNPGASGIRLESGW